MPRKILFRLTIAISIILAGCAPKIDVTPTSLPATATLTTIPAKFKDSHDGSTDHVEAAECRAYGWVTDLNQPDKDVPVRVLVDGTEAAQDIADQTRSDLAAFKRCEGGSCAFEFDLSTVIAPETQHTIEVQAWDEGQNVWITLDKSPRTLTCAKMTGLLEGTRETTRDPSGRLKFQVGVNYLIIEFLDDDLLHVEYSGVETQTDLSQPLHTTPMIAKKDYKGPSKMISDDQGMFETSSLKVQVDPSTLCLTAWDITRQPALTLTTMCPRNLGKNGQGITMTAESFTQAYGLGEFFLPTDSGQVDWMDRSRTPGSAMGNAMNGWNGGGVGNAQFPIAYFVGGGLDNYALFADNAYAQTWNFRDDPWQVKMGGNWLRFYLMSGSDLQDLRKDYLELVGHPLVPPKKAFGLWISEFGYDNWSELEDKLSTLRKNNFPVDGFVLDLQWFGGIQSGSDYSRMGSLSWDTTKFPDPAGKIKSLKDTQGIGIITIEESYISRGLPEHQQLADQGYLAKACSTCPPSYLISNPWWGQGGLIDWTNPNASTYWHDTKREPLIKTGVIGHWTDLGEPEMYDPTSWYYGITGDYTALNKHADIHNMFNLMWSQSIYDGYVRNNETQRPFIISRSGTSGSQRYGVAMWSGDIGSNLSSLTEQMNVQAHMSLSGMDYFGADIGGFHRGGLDGDLNEMYMQWFSSGSMLDVPVRVHTENLCNCKETAPDRIGDLESNLANIRLRYALSPYLYSLSHRAYLYGEPVFPPLVYYYQTDPSVREIADEKLIGANLLTLQVSEFGAKTRLVYLPAGDWFDYHSNKLYHSSGETIGPLMLYREDRFTLPLFARAGALIPQMVVDDQTMNILGMRKDDSVRNELIVRAYAGDAATEFTLYEDDGATIAYQSGSVRTTKLSQQNLGSIAQVTISASQGNFDGAIDSRTNVVILISESAGKIIQVTLNEETLSQFNSLAEWERASSGWFYAGGNVIMAKSTSMPVAEEKVFEFKQ